MRPGASSLVAVVAALPAFVELYPTSVRFSGMALPYNVAYAVFGGTAPLVSEPLVSELLVTGTGTLIAPAIYASAVAR